MVLLPFPAIGVKEAWSTRAQLEQGGRAIGVVVSNKLVVTHRDGYEEQAYRPVVQFKTPDGTFTVTDPVGSLPPDHEPGTSVELSYPLGAPEKARIVSFKRLWLVPTIFIAVGLVPLAILGVVFHRLSRGVAQETS